jgi:hypothetical protein
VCKGKGEDKFNSTTCHEIPEKEQRYSYTLSLISALGTGVWLKLRPTRERGPVPILQDAMPTTLSGQKGTEGKVNGT